MEKLEKYTKRPRQSSNLETNRVKFSYILIECVLPHFLIQGKACVHLPYVDFVLRPPYELT